MKSAYLAMAAVLLLVGALGFFQNPLLGLFEVNALHNVIHLASGVLTLLAAWQGIGPMRRWGKTFGLFYLGVAIAGWLAPAGDLFGLMHLNVADNVLHLALSLFFLYFGLLAPPTR